MKSTRFSQLIKNDNFILRDHLVHQVRVLPGVTYLDMVYRFGGKLIGHHNFHLNKVLFIQPLTTDADAGYDQEVRVDFVWRGTDYAVSIECRRNKNGKVLDENWRRIMECVVELAPSSEESEKLNTFLPIDFITAAKESWNISEVYKSVRDLNIEHGVFMQTLGKVYQLGFEELMVLRLSDLAEEYREFFHAHPALLDASTLAGSSFQLNHPDLTTFEDGVPYIPFSIEKARIVSRLPQEIYVHSVMRNDKQGIDTNRDLTFTDIRAYDRSGNLLFELVKLANKRIRADESIRRYLGSNKASHESASSVPLNTSLNTRQPVEVKKESSGDLSTHVKQFVKEKVALRLGKAADTLEEDVSFYDLGLESKDLLEITEELERHCGHDLYPTLLFEYKTISEIVGYLSEEEAASFQDQPQNQDSAKVLQNTSTSQVSISASHEQKIAVIGMAGRYPGAKNLKEFWEIVESGRNHISDIPPSRWSTEDFQNSQTIFDANAPTSRSAWGGLIDDADKFDPLFFGISPREVKSMDPQLRVLLEVAWETFEAAGYVPNSLANASVGVYTGVMNSDFTWLAAEHYQRTGSYIGPGTSIHELSNRLSYQLDFHGPSITVANACASSLTAIHLAVEAIRSGSCDLALAGGVNLNLHPQKYWMLSQLGIVSGNDQEKTFDQAADGYVPAEGAGMVLLKPLSNALQDGDSIYGVILGSSISHAGKGSGKYVPDMATLTRGVESCLQQAGLVAEKIGYIEAHGTGTVLGDPVEVQALAKAFPKTQTTETECALGSKANIGHLESASGVCSLTKVLLSIQNGQIPPCANVENINAALRLETTPFYIPTQSKSWTVAKASRVAGVHSFGVGGASGFLLVSGAPEPIVSTHELSGHQLIILSAQSTQTLTAIAKNLVQFCKSEEGKTQELRNIAFTLQVGRLAMPYRLAIVVDTLDLLINKLDRFASELVDENTFVGHAKKGGDKTTDGSDWVAKTHSSNSGRQSTEWLRELAGFWVKGKSVVWEELHSDNSLKRISLPTYPFEQRSFPWPKFAKSQADQRELEFEDLIILGPTMVPEKVSDTFEQTGFAKKHVLCIDLPKKISRMDIKVGLAHCHIYFIDSAHKKVERRYLDYTQQVIAVLQKVLATRPKEKILFQITGFFGGTNKLFTGLNSIFKTAHLENPKVHSQFVAVEQEYLGSRKKNWADFFVDLIKQNVVVNKNAFILHSSSGRYIPRWEEIAVKDATSIWRENGVYLISGGLGAIGRLLTQQILSQAPEAKIVLLVRSKPNEERQAWLNKFSRSANVTCRLVDIANGRQVTKCVNELLKQHGCMHGILHCAGSLADGFIVQKKPEKISHVLTPKVNGTINLDRATKDIKLDFFILFGSTSAVLGNSGQSDYAAANAFLDEFAKYRDGLVRKKQRAGKTLAIDWPHWQAGGMKISDKVLEKLQTEFGLVSLETKKAWYALQQGLQSEYSQIMVLQGDTSSIKEWFDIEQRVPVNSEAEVGYREGEKPEGEKKSQNGASNNTRAALQEKLKQLVSGILEIEHDFIDFEAELGDYGFESITLTEFSEVLNKELGTDVTPAFFYEFSTLESFSEYLYREYQSKLEHYFNPTWASRVKSPRTEFVPESSFDQFPSGGQRKNIEQTPSTPPPVAIVGISARFPMANDLNTFWENLQSGRDCIGEIPLSRWDWKLLYGDTGGKSKNKWGGFIEGIDEFDPLFFGISPREAELMDPQQRLLMMHIWNAIEDAGYAPDDLAGSKTAIMVAIAANGYSDLIARARIKPEIYSSTGIVPSVGPNRMSYLLDLKGPSEPIETACSSSLVAIHRAVQLIQSGECIAALAGGVNTIISPDIHVSFDKAGMLSKAGRCKTFSDRADGYVRGEGIGILYLKDLQAAKRANDPIYAVIRSSAENHGGKAAALTAPNPKAQAELLVSAYKKAGIDPRTISYIETHGTGTELGDPIEINGLKAAFKDLYRDSNPAEISEKHCALGSVKTNIGHLELAAGVAGVCKIVMQLQHKKLAKNLHLQEVNPYIRLDDSPFYLLKETCNWETTTDNSESLPRRAGISSFGFGGANAHIVLEEYLADSSGSNSLEQTKPVLIVLSARSKHLLGEIAKNLLMSISKQSFLNKDLVDIAYTLKLGRSAMQQRLAIVAYSLDDLQEKLADFVSDTGHGTGYYFGSVGKSTQRDKEPVAVSKTTLDSWIAERNYASLAQHWVNGGKVGWENLYANCSPRRLHLPVYPFDKQGYWVPNSRSLENKYGQTDRLHPLVHKNTSDQCGLRYSSEFSQEDIEALFCSSEANFELPLFCVVEMVDFVFNHLRMPATDKQPICVKDFAVRRPVVFMSDFAGKTCLHVEVDFIEDEMTFSVSQQTNGVFEVHYEGMVYAVPEYLNASKGISNLNYKSDELDGYVAPSEISVDALEIIKANKLQNGKELLVLFSVSDSHLLKAVTGVAESRILDCLTDIYWRLQPDSEANELKYSQFSAYTGLGAEKKLQEKMWVHINGSKTLNGELINDLKFYDSEGSLIYTITGLQQTVVFAQETLVGSNDNFLIDYEQDPSLSMDALPIKENGLYIILGPQEPATYLAVYNAFTTVPSAKLILCVPNISIKEKLETQHALKASVVEIVPEYQEQKIDALFEKIETHYGAVSGIVCVDDAAEGRVVDIKSAGSSIKFIDLLAQTDSVSSDIDLDFFAAVSVLLQPSDEEKLNKTWSAIEDYVLQRRSLEEQNKRLGSSVHLQWTLGKLNLVELLNIAMPSLALNERDQISRRGIEGNGSNSGDVRSNVESYLIRLVSKLLKLREDQVDFDVKLSEFGFNSMSILELTKEINAKYHLSLKPAIFFDHQSLGEFLEFLLNAHLNHLTKSDRSSVLVSKTSPRAQTLVGKRRPNRGWQRGRRTLHPDTKPDPIAIVGMSGRFPLAADLEEFWHNLEHGRDCIQEIPSQRWDWRAIYGDPADDPNKTQIKWGGFIDGVYDFDPLFFGISPKEARMMDPQQRLTMMYVWKAIEDAGYSPESLSGSKTGIFVGTAPSGYNELVARSGAVTDDFGCTGMVASLGPNRVSYFLNLRGPSEPVETSCSSSLVAIRRAILAIQSNACDAAIVGGVNTILTPWAHVSLGKAGMLSIDGRCKTFSDEANGYARGEGVGFLYLKPLRDAEQAGDSIYGVIRSSAENHGGRANSLTAPNPAAQAELLVDAYTQANIDPETIDYIEAHGTGTELGDPVEINGLKNAFQKLYAANRKTLSSEPSCALGSVKTNIGHLELAAGVAGVIKVLLQLKHSTLVKNVHLEKINPHIDEEQTPFYFLQENRQWPQKVAADGSLIPRRAGVSSFGFGGVNAHVVIEEYIPRNNEAEVEAVQNNEFLILLAAKTDVSLRGCARQLKNYASSRCENFTRQNMTDSEQRLCIRNIAYTTQMRVSLLPERLAIVVTSLEELVGKLEDYLEGNQPTDVFDNKISSQEKETSQFFLAGDSSEDLLQFMLVNKEVKKLAFLWCIGNEVRWERLYAGQNPKRVSLPSYSFDCQQYWVPEAQELVQAHSSKEEYRQKIPGLSKELDKAVADLAGSRDAIAGFVDISHYEQTAKGQRNIAHLCLLRAFQNQGVLKETGFSASKADLAKSLKITNGYMALYSATLDILEEASFVKIDGDTFAGTAKISDAEISKQLNNLDQEISSFSAKYPETQSFLRLLVLCTDNLFAVQRGEKNYIEVMFPNSSLELVGNLDCGSQILDYYNKISAAMLAAYVGELLSLDPKASINIIDITTGSGGTSEFLLESIAEFKANVNYCCTDVSTELVNSRKNRLQAKYPFTEFKVLNIEEPLAKQGFRKDSVDIVYAGNSISSARSVGKCIKELKSLLHKNGLLILKEMTTKQAFSTLTFGLTSGWWHSQDHDKRQPNSPLLSGEQWRYELEDCGFNKVRIVGPQYLGIERTFQHLIFGESDGVCDHQASTTDSKYKLQKNTSTSNAEIEGASELEKTIAEIWQEVLGVDAIGLADSFLDLGGSSLVATQIISRIKKRFPIELNLSSLFDASTVSAMANLVEEEILSHIEEMAPEEVAEILA